MSASINNAEMVKKHPRASCYYCMRSFATSNITEWTDNGATALCPHCNVDAVLPGEVSIETLNYLHARWFKTTDVGAR